ncbi:hypothetical protein [Mucilaginibacter sp.]|uniref:hypothetical protein n=1 Tax=Mucilaginibacter sp. TaxID=1882438 RepID=UPI0025DD2984|nr:hypothetical protein [Mucilaginibacter sp.]
MKEVEKKVVGYSIMVILLFAGLVYGIINNINAKRELRFYEYVDATVIERDAGRSHSNIYVEFVYKRKRIQSEFSTQVDTFKLGQKVLLKVSKRYPDKFIQFIR